MSDYISVEEVAYNLKEASIKEIFKTQSTYKYTYLSMTLLFAIVGIVKYTFSTDDEAMLIAARLLLTSCFLGIVGSLIYNFSYDPTEYHNPNSPLVENKKGNFYHLNMAYEVKKFLGSGIKSLKQENLTGRFVLLHAEVVKRMGAVIGTPGSGKTVQLKGMLEQQTALGGGWCSFDAKGTIDELKNVYALVGKYGRLNDFYVLNFANKENSHSINLFASGTAFKLKENLVGLISSTDAKWQKVDEDFIEAIFKLLVFKRDNEDFIITFRELRKYLTLPKLVNEAWAYRKYTDDIGIYDFCSYVCTKIEIDIDEFLAAKENDKEFQKKLNDNANTQDKQGVYEVGLSAGNWQGIFTTLGSNYGNIFNAEDADVDLFEIVQNNKMLWIVLPTMDSESTARQLGKLFLGIIKDVADRKIKTSYEPKIPFLFLLDEFGSFGIVGFGLFMSKARSLGMAMWLYFQSIAQLDVIDDGKGLERKAILNMCNTFGVMKNNDKDLAVELSALVPEERFLQREYNEKKFWRNNKDTSATTSYQVDKREAFKAYNFSGLKDGEMYCFVGNEYYKAVSAAPSDFNLTYQKYNIRVNFDLIQVYPKNKFINDLRRYQASIFDDNLFYA